MHLNTGPYTQMYMHTVTNMNTQIQMNILHLLHVLCVSLRSPSFSNTQRSKYWWNTCLSQLCLRNLFAKQRVNIGLLCKNLTIFVSCKYSDIVMNINIHTTIPRVASTSFLDTQHQGKWHLLPCCSCYMDSDQSCSWSGTVQVQ